MRYDYGSVKVHNHNLYLQNMCDCPPLAKTESIKYLGVIIDENLTFKPHLETLAARLRKLIYFLGPYAILRTNAPSRCYITMFGFDERGLVTCNTGIPIPISGTRLSHLILRLLRNNWKDLLRQIDIRNFFEKGTTREKRKKGLDSSSGGSDENDNHDKTHVMPRSLHANIGQASHSPA
ncbi:hypothetical protein evm_002272 [Chilo suppressalis]|nr:hypothetical protein evm_002272 [Chilo suppressalis]